MRFRAIRAVVQADPLRDRVNVYVFADRHALTPNGWVYYDEAAQALDPPRFLSVEADVFEAIMRATEDRPHTTSAQDALKDARTTRDRLFTLVEKLTDR